MSENHIPLNSVIDGDISEFMEFEYQPQNASRAGQSQEYSNEQSGTADLQMDDVVATVGPFTFIYSISVF